MPPVRIATLLVADRAPVTRVTQHLSGRAPSTLKRWFMKCFPGVKITRWGFKMGANLATIEVRGFCEAATTQMANPRVTKPRTRKPVQPTSRRNPLPSKARERRKRLGKIYAAQLSRKKAFRARKQATAAPSTKPHKGMVPKPLGRKPKRQRSTFPTRAHVVVVGQLPSRRLGYRNGVFVDDCGVRPSRLLERARAARKAYGVSLADVITTEVHQLPTGGRVVVIISKNTVGMQPMPAEGREVNNDLLRWLQSYAAQQQLAQLHARSAVAKDLAAAFCML